MDFVIEENLCTGCTACYYKCNLGAIKLVKNENGFVVPRIDQSICVDCNECIKACPHNSLNLKKFLNDEKQIVYAMKSKDNGLRMDSSSGGMFTILSKNILGKGGIIFASGYDEDFNVIHKSAENEDEVKLLRGSKYVQSDLKNVFEEIRFSLDSKRKTMFIGTPCQVAGLKSYLNNEYYENLLTCDLVCHGTPSPMIWSEYINFEKNKKNKRDIQDIKFRDKKHGWHEPSFVIDYSKDKFSEHLASNYFGILFLHNIILRESCYNCRFTCENRVGDITLGDFWGIEKNHKEFDDNKGVSLVIINNEKGLNVFKSIKDKCILKESNMKECLQPNLQYPSMRNPKTPLFWEDYKNNGFDYVLKKYCEYTFVGVIKRKVLMPFVKKIGLYKFLLGLRK